VASIRFLQVGGGGGGDGVVLLCFTLFSLLFLLLRLMSFLTAVAEETDGTAFETVL
jgi:hypothetical protein